MLLLEVKNTVVLYSAISIILLIAILTTGCQQDTQRTTPDSSPSIPSAPVNLEANALSPNIVELRWLDNSNNESGFKIYRGTILIGTVPVNDNIFQDTGLQPKNTYQYAVRAYNQAGESQIALCSVTTPGPPNAPSNLVASSLTHREVQIIWTDNSSDEFGFKIYRDGTLTANIGADDNSYLDISLQPATSYQYTVVAYNEFGESNPYSAIIKTRNPPITIRLDGIGVYDNRESLLRGVGDVYVLIGVVDGIQAIYLRFPSDQNQTYSLDKNETVSIGTTIYSTDEVSDNFQIIVIGYESDGGLFEQIAYEALGMAVDYYVTGGAAAGLAEAFDISLASIIGSLLGAEDDFLGRYELSSDKSNNWGIGQYINIVLQDERYIDCLRLWFTIETQ